jgi:hypothetical protein
MTYQEYDTRVNGVIRDLQTGAHGEVMVKMAMKALSMIKDRVQEKGTNAKGQKYKPYSTKPMLVGCKTFVTKSACSALLGSAKKRKELEWRTVGGKRLAILPGGYKKVRELEGRQTNHVDFSVTNDMWNDINVISKQGDHQRGVAIIGARQETEKRKLEGNTKRRGNILDLSRQEIDQLKKDYNLQVLQIFRNNGL